MQTMIRTPAPARHPKHPKHQHGDCGCGCGGGCESGCCELECLERPNFFCGQLLTDTELTGLVRWVRSRLSLQRYRDGWGVVCGLDVRCGHHDPCNRSAGPSVMVAPGYAIDCCGRDLVLCEPYEVDLSEFCRPTGDPCADPEKVPPPAQAPDPTYKRSGIKPDIEVTWPLDKTDAIAVNLYLQYAETMAGGTRTVFGSHCGDSSGCRHTRVLEAPRVVALLGEVGKPAFEDPMLARRNRIREELREMREALYAINSPEELIRRLGEEEWELSSFCFVVDQLRRVVQTKSRGEEWLKQARIWIMQDWFNRRMQCECTPCRTDDGVLLGQVWLIPATTRDGKRTCRVAYVLDRPPHRRLLRRDCTPVTDPYENLGHLVWKEWNSSIATDLVNRGFLVEAQPRNVVEMPADEVRQFHSTFTTAASADSKAVAYVMPDPMGTMRIAGFGAPIEPSTGPKKKNS